MAGELRPGRAEMNRLTTTLRITGEPASVVSLQDGQQRQAIWRGSDPSVGGDPRLKVDFSSGPALLYADRAQRRQVGERLGNTVRLWSEEYRVHRQWLWPKLSFTVTTGGRTVLRARERLRPADGARTFDTHSDPSLDPVVTLALILLEGRPHRMRLGRGHADPL
ncbi:hypothetical protein ACQEWB_25565 [Streptomyces sp. CA-249302]|uniref:hypothetical protein n=1 Tax=Streptomyces sp. CA-249302 TaxID=3240058 RepID=UPI003D8FCE40